MIEPGLRHNTNFKRLWLGQSISLMGTNVASIAIPLLAIYTINAGAFEVGLIGLVETLSYLVVMFWAATWIDGRPRFPTLLISDIVRAILLAAIAALALTRLLSVVTLVVLVLVVGIFSALFEVVCYSILQSIVHRSDLIPANGRLQTSVSLALIAGPTVGGTLVQLASAPITLLVNALTFGMSAALKRTRSAEATAMPIGPRVNVRRQIHEGLAYMARNRLLQVLTVSSALYNFFANWIITLFPIFAVKDLRLEAGTIGVVRSFEAIGSVISAIFSVKLVQTIGAGRSYVWAKTIAWVSLFAIAFTPAHNALTVIMLVIAFALSGMLVVSNVVGVTLRQAITSAAMQDPVAATHKFLSYGALALGALSAGIAGNLLGLRAGMITGGIGLVSTVLVVLTPGLLRMRDLPFALAEQEDRESA